MDWRDQYYSFNRIPLREEVDLMQWCSPVQEQLQLGSCSAQAIVGAYEILLNKEAPEKYVPLSKLFAYYNARLIEGNVTEDTGAFVRDIIKGVAQFGICKEILWPYIVENFKTVPPLECYNDARHRTIKNYYRLNGLSDILDALNSGFPVVFGMQVFPQFATMEMNNQDTVEIPPKGQELIGGHAMVLVGYNLNKQLVVARNSFGPDWGRHGHCWIPFEYIKKYTLDSWIFDIEIS